MNLGVQYYRPPFPVDRHWEKDFDLIRRSGLDTVQLWLVWAWIESKPGIFDFNDYDRLVELADKKGLKVVLSTIAEIHPYWIHREVPDSEMIDHMGHKVVSSNRCEIHFGLTPGGCFDHPGVWERMKGFLEASVKQYRGAVNLAGWDCWNELRWHVHADALVCFCPHTLSKFRGWLDRAYGGLDGLNRAWMRRYGSWDEVLPGKWIDRPYTEMMAWQQFLTWRSNDHARLRYEVMKPLDPDRDVTAHAATPTPLKGSSLSIAGEGASYPADRGNDWALADVLDGVGCSSFPKWFGMDEAAFGMRIETIKSAAQGKKVWLSEIQGGRSAVGFDIYAPVDAASQQRWIWTGIACGADKLLFWCWRDEVFGRESAGFGIIGRDGLAEERVAALQKTRETLNRHSSLLESYKPDLAARVGVLYSPDSTALAFAQEGSSSRISNGFMGYLRALTRLSIPYRVVDPDHLKTGLAGLKILFLPRVIVTSVALEEQLGEFIRKGGTVVCESECGAFSPEGIYRYPDERWTARLTGIAELGRRSLASPLLTFKGNGKPLSLGVEQWLTPFDLPGRPLRAEKKFGKGRIILFGSYLGGPYMAKWRPGFEGLLLSLCTIAGVDRPVQVVSPLPKKEGFVYVKTGEADGRKVIFLFFPEGAKKAVVRLAPGFIKSGKLAELFTRRLQKPLLRKGKTTVEVKPNEFRMAILLEDR